MSFVFASVRVIKIDDSKGASSSWSRIMKFEVFWGVILAENAKGCQTFGGVLTFFQ